MCMPDAVLTLEYEISCVLPHQPLVYAGVHIVMVMMLQNIFMHYVLFLYKLLQVLPAS